MSTSVLDLFNIGIGPSSSHTVGPLKAATAFIQSVRAEHGLEKVGRVAAKLYGSLGATGRGHGSDTAILLGLMGVCPKTVDVEAIGGMVDTVRKNVEITLLGEHKITFHEDEDLQLLPRERLDFHPNGMEFWAYDTAGNELSRAIYYSIGGGFIVSESEAKVDHFDVETVKFKYPLPKSIILMSRR